MKPTLDLSCGNKPLFLALALFAFTSAPVDAQTHKYLTEVPDYTWYAGCFGTACGNLMGFWDRHGMDNFYSGPTALGVAPLNSYGANVGIRSMWATRAGFDGRPANKPGHIDDYWLYYANDGSYSYESTLSDTYVLSNRVEHTPDCVGDFIGLSQKKWTNLGGECDGNIDAYSFVFWDKTGHKRVNYANTNATGQYIPDIQSGLRAWTRYRGYDADVFTQLTDFNRERSTTNGFTFEDLKAEINAGYPVLCFLQPTTEFSRSLPGMPKANPEIHGVTAYGYYEDAGFKGAVIRTSWGSGDGVIMEWSGNPWLGLFPPRGVIGFHPKPKITSVTRNNGIITVNWDGPGSELFDAFAATATNVHHYQLERSPSLNPPSFKPVGSLTTERTVTVPDCCGGTAFYRVQLVP